MDNDSQIAMRVFEQLALAHNKLSDFSAHLNTRPEVTNVNDAFTYKRYLNGNPTLVAYVEVGLRNDTSVSWYLDATWEDDHWVIGSEIFMNRTEYAEPIKDLPDRTAFTLDDFFIQLNGAIADLITGEDSINAAL